MARWHTHSIFGQQHTHSTLFRHTSKEDQEAHHREIHAYRLGRQNSRLRVLSHNPPGAAGPSRRRTRPTMRPSTGRSARKAAALQPIPDYRLL